MVPVARSIQGAAPPIPPTSASGAAEAKAALRERMRDAREATPPAERARLSWAIADRILASAPYLAARSIALYASFRGEAAADVILETALADGKKVAFPRMGPTRGEMTLRWIDGRAGLRPGRRGVLEPAESAPVAEATDLLLAPGLAFDLRGARLGWGLGYYDRFLRGRSGFALGVAYDFQVTDALPVEAHDARMDAVATESRWIECARAGGGRRP